MLPCVQDRALYIILSFSAIYPHVKGYCLKDFVRAHISAFLSITRIVLCPAISTGGKKQIPNITHLRYPVKVEYDFIA